MLFFFSAIFLVDFSSVKIMKRGPGEITKEEHTPSSQGDSLSVCHPLDDDDDDDFTGAGLDVVGAQKRKPNGHGVIIISGSSVGNGEAAQLALPVVVVRVDTEHKTVCLQSAAAVPPISHSSSSSSSSAAALSSAIVVSLEVAKSKAGVALLQWLVGPGMTYAKRLFACPGRTIASRLDGQMRQAIRVKLIRRGVAPGQKPRPVVADWAEDEVEFATAVNSAERPSSRGTLGGYSEEERMEQTTKGL